MEPPTFDDLLFAYENFEWKTRVLREHEKDRDNSGTGYDPYGDGLRRELDKMRDTLKQTFDRYVLALITPAPADTATSAAVARVP